MILLLPMERAAPESLSSDCEVVAEFFAVFSATFRGVGISSTELLSREEAHRGLEASFSSCCGP